MTETTTYEKGKLYDVPITDLMPDPNQPRKTIDPVALEDLTASVAKNGVIQPILFRVAPPNLLIVSGERRFKASQNVGLLTIPGICVEGNYAEIALVENLMRQDLTPVEEAEALDRLMKGEGYTQEQLAVIVGKARNTVTEILSLNRLPQDIRDECRGNTAVARKTLIVIARKKQARGMATAWNKIKDKMALEAAGGRKLRTVPTPATQRDWLDSTSTKLAALDFAAWSEEEKAAFNASLTALKATIEALLNPPAPSNLA